MTQLASVVAWTDATLAGQLAILGALVVIVAAIFRFSRAQVIAAVDERLNDPKAALSMHKIDPDAHEAMREKMFDRIELRLNRIDAAIAENRKEVHSDFVAFQSNIIAPIMKQNEATLGLLASAMNRERKFVVRKDDED